MSVTEELKREDVMFWMGKLADEMFKKLAGHIYPSTAETLEGIYAAIIGKIGGAYVLYLECPMKPELNVFAISPKPLSVHLKYGVR